MLIACIIVFIYLLIMLCKIKMIPSSISETFYLGGGYWFTVVMFIVSFLIVAGMLDLTEGSNWQFLSFLTASGLAFVGAAPHFHDSEKVIHYVGAAFMLIGSQIWISIFSSPLILLTWVLSIFWIRNKNSVFWAEITCIFNLMFSLFFL